MIVENKRVVNIFDKKHNGRKETYLGDKLLKVEHHDGSIEEYLYDKEQRLIKEVKINNNFFKITRNERE